MKLLPCQQSLEQLTIDGIMENTRQLILILKEDFEDCFEK